MIGWGLRRAAGGAFVHTVPLAAIRGLQRVNAIEEAVLDASRVDVHESTSSLADNKERLEKLAEWPITQAFLHYEWRRQDLNL